MTAKVTRLRTVPPARTLRPGAEAFLDTIGSANTRRAYGIAIVKTVEQLDGRGPDGLLGTSPALESVTDAEVGAALEALWGTRRSTPGTRAAPPSAKAFLVHRARLDRTEGSRVGRTVNPAGLRHPDSLAHRDRPAHRPPRHPPARDYPVADAVRDLRPR
ncbi:hypothetical protein ABZ540_11665 [Nocardia xishanensis]|uniref:hypothetical protein n=1 Tax=Nocardia xishanensis TaxID=238964 RepID=UPI0033F9E8B2